MATGDVVRPLDASLHAGRNLAEAQILQVTAGFNRAFVLKGKPGYDQALREIEDWQVETAPERLARPKGAE